MGITPMQMARLAAKYDLRSDSGRVEYCAEISQLIASLKSAVEREVYIVRAAKAANISHESMRREVDNTRKQIIARRNNMENEICGVFHDVAQAREDLEKALCVLGAHSSTDDSCLLAVVQDYIMQANAKWLYSAENQLDALRKKYRREATTNE